PFPDGTFDLVTAVETQYFWPDLIGDTKEIRRVLKPGGTFVVIAEAYKAGAVSAIEGLAMKLMQMAYLSVAEQRDLFSQAGYENVEVFEERSRRWICVIGRNAV